MKLVVSAWGFHPPVTPPPVRSELVEAGACSLIGLHACAKGGCRDVPPAGHLLFLRRQEKKAKEGDPKSATPSRCEGANLRRCGCGVRRGTRFAAAQRRSDSHGESDDEAWAHWRPCHPATAPPQAQPQGLDSREQPNSHTGRRCARPSLSCAQRAALAPAKWGRAKQWPEWLFGCLAPPSPLYAPRSAAASGSGLAIV